MNKYRNYIYLGLLFFLVILSHKNWININSIIFSWDFPYFFNSLTNEFFLNGQGLWIGYTNFGFYNVQPYFNGFMYIWGLFSNYDLALRVTLLFPILLIQVFGGVLFLNSLFNRGGITFPVFIGTLYFIFNSYFLYTSLSHLLILFSASMLPLLLWSYIKLLRQHNNKNIIIFCLLFTISCIYELRITIINIFVLIIVSLYYFPDFIRLLRNWKIIIQIILLSLLLNSYWLLGIFVGNFGTEVGDIINRGVFGNKFTNILYSITGFKPYWNSFGLSEDFILKPIPIFIFSLLILIILNIIFSRKEFKKVGLLSLMLLIISTLLLKQDASPFDNTYTWLYNNLPGFAIFREGSKFSIISVLAYTIGISLFFVLLEEWKGNKHFIVLIKIFFLFVILVPATPIFLNHAKYNYDSRVYHEDYKAINNVIVNENGNYKTFSVPIKHKLVTSSFRNPGVRLTSPEIYGLYGILDQEEGDDFIKKSQKFFSYEFIDNFFKLGGIKYIIVGFQDSENQDDIFRWYGEKDVFIKMIEGGLKNFKKDEYGRISVYKNPEYYDIIYLSDKLISSLDISNHKLWNAEQIRRFLNIGYKFNITNLSESIFVNLSQNNNADWYLSFNYIDEGIFNYHSCAGLGDKQDSLGFLNSWHISKNQVLDYIIMCYSQELSTEGYPRPLNDGRMDYKYYIQNPDGSIDVELTLYFRPQLYFYIGLIISGTTLAILIISLVVISLRERRTRRESGTSTHEHI